MEKNVGSSDRIARFVIALALFGLIALGYLAGTAALIAGIVAAALLISAIFSRCLLYKLAGIDTCVRESSYSTTDDRAGL